MSESDSRVRAVSVKVHLHLDLFHLLDEIAKRRGFPLATLLAVVAGEFVERVTYDLQTRRIVALEVARRLGSVSVDGEGGDGPCSTSDEVNTKNTTDHTNPHSR